MGGLYHRFTDWPKDVACLADHLGFERFAVMGYSASGPYTLACAHQLAERLTAVGVVSGAAQRFSASGATKGRPTITLWTTARIHPRLTWLLFRIMRNTIANARRDQLPKSAKQAMMAEADYQFIKERPYVMANNMDGGTEAPRQGGLGPAEYWKPWGFHLEDIRMKVHVWHGEADINAPFDSHGPVLAQKLPRVEAKFFPDEGYISQIYKYLETILQTFVQPQFTALNHTVQMDSKNSPDGGGVFCSLRLRSI